ncbi:transcriptional regulator [Enterobacter roggenkampii]|uniref:transcriptional regulator n=1 Tax=Enterobacter roggenkampii TaxID=1812935 RepID=UPI001FD7BFE2|nr:transcriptional regulator [Enterobacter roggenkampii]
MSTELHRWRKGATTDEWAQLAKLANTTPCVIDQTFTEIVAHHQKWHRRSKMPMKEFHRQDPVLKESLSGSPRNNTAA